MTVRVDTSSNLTRGHSVVRQHSTPLTFVGFSETPSSGRTPDFRHQERHRSLWSRLGKTMSARHRAVTKGSGVILDERKQKLLHRNQRSTLRGTPVVHRHD